MHRWVSVVIVVVVGSFLSVIKRYLWSCRPISFLLIDSHMQ